MGKKFRELGQQESITDKTILISPSVFVGNHRMRHWEFMAARKKVTNQKLTSDVWLDDYVDGLKSQLFFSRVALRLADAFPDYEVIIQPKKSEILESWRQSLYAVDDGDGTRTNLSLGRDEMLEESVHRSAEVLNSTSTAGVTALIGEVPLISFGPTASLASELGARTTNVDMAVSLTRQAITNPTKFIGKYERRDKERLRDRIRPNRNSLAAEAIVKNWESMDSVVKKSSLTTRDLILFLEPGALRRIGSGLKSLLRLNFPTVARSEKIMRVKQSTAQNLLDSITLSMEIEQRLRLTVAGRRNIIVRPEE